MKNKPNRYFSFLLFITIFFFPFSKAFAEKIQAFNSDIEINKNGTITVEESITYDTGGLQKHGLLRKIDFKRVNEDNKTYIMGIDILSITDENGNAYNFSKSKIGKYIELKIGDADKLFSGQKTYVIKYQVSGGITYFSDHDELYWNMTGNYWPFSIESFNGTIKLPEGVGEGDVQYICYEGPDGSTSQSCLINRSSGILNISSSRVLGPGEGVTIGVPFPKNLVSVLEPREDKPSLILRIFQLFMAVLASIWYVFLPIKVVVDYIKEKAFTNRNQRIVSAWFQPPQYDNGVVFTPAETGFIIDKTIDHKELTATIIQLAQRGYLKIKEDEKNHFTFIKLKDIDSSELRNFEKEVLKAIFEKGDEVADKELKNSTSVFSKIVLFNEYVEGEVFKEKMFERRPTEVLAKNMILFGIGVTTMNFVLAIVAIIFGRKSAKRTLIGVNKYSEAVSLFNFLKSQDEQLNFQSKNQMFFEKLLPFAAAFGVEKIWAGRFKDISLVKPDWYEGNNFTTSAFVGSMTHNIGGSMRSVAASGMSSTRSSSGFSSGFSGGHSGGGGGGGGGGSW